MWTGTDQNVSCEEDADVLSLCDSAGKQTIEDFLYVGGGKVIPLTHSVTHSDIVMVSLPKFVITVKLLVHGQLRMRVTCDEKLLLFE